MLSAGKNIIKISTSNNSRKNGICNIFFVMLFFGISFLNQAVLIIWLIGGGVVFIIRGHILGALEFLLLITLRGSINSAIAVPISGYSQIVKWCLIFLLSFYILICSIHHSFQSHILNTIIFITIFSFYCCISSLLYSSYPVVSVFKVLSFYIPFIAVIVAVSGIDNNIIFDKVIVYLGLVVVFSIIFIPLKVGYFLNPSLFQGIINHPNLFGIICVLFFAAYLNGKRKKSLCTLIAFLTILYLVYISRSRTSTFSLLFIVIIGFVTSRVSFGKKIIIILCGLLLILGGIYFFNDALSAFVESFIYKGNKGSIFYSRDEIFKKNIDRFLTHPWSGTGFNVPYIEGKKSFQFNFNLATENGNLFLALLADTGIIGFILFLIAYSYIFFHGRGVILFGVPFIVSMGEMMFFSTNNLSIFYYLFFALYLNNYIRRKKEL